MRTRNTDLIVSEVTRSRLVPTTNFSSIFTSIFKHWTGGKSPKDSLGSLILNRVTQTESSYDTIQHFIVINLTVRKYQCNSIHGFPVPSSNNFLWKGPIVSNCIGVDGLKINILFFPYSSYKDSPLVNKGRPVTILTIVGNMTLIFLVFCVMFSCFVCLRPVSCEPNVACVLWA